MKQQDDFLTEMFREGADKLTVQPSRRAWANLEAKLEQRDRRPSRNIYNYITTAAAVVAIVTMISAIAIFRNSPENAPTAAAPKFDTPTLTLSNSNVSDWRKTYAATSLETELHPLKNVRIDDFSWLVGTWSDANAPQNALEKWEKTADGTLRATASQTENGKTTVIETMNLQTQNGKLRYELTLSETGETLQFELHSFSLKTATFLNLKSGFPHKLVLYRTDDNGFIVNFEAESDFENTPLNRRNQPQAAKMSREMHRK